MGDCIFCKIADGRIPATLIYENDLVLAFDDIHPMAPVHVIVIPKVHIPTLLDLGGNKQDTLNALVSAVQEVARIKGIDRKGFRMVVNCNDEGGQVIYHLHAHVLGGRRLDDELG